MNASTAETNQTLDMIARASAAFATPDSQRARQVRDNADGHDPATWLAMSEQGWLAALLPEDQGGVDLGIGAAAIIAERLGYACYAEPYVAVGVVAATCLALCPDSRRRGELLTALGAGEQSIAVAWQSPRGDLDIGAARVEAERLNGGASLCGSLRFVVPARAEVFVVAARLRGELGLYAVRADDAGLTIKQER